MFRIVQPMGEEDRGEVDVRKVATSEVSCAILGKVFDPLCPRGEVALWIVRVGVSMSPAHSRIDESVGTCQPIKATTMKRPPSSSSVPSKKQKTSPCVQESQVILPEGDPADAQWEKVERRKSKKQRKTNAKLDVCVSHIIAHRSTQTHSSSQANPPRFLYSNSEITKRRDPVGVNVLSPHLILCLRLPLQPGYSRSCPSHHSRCPTTELDQSTGQCFPLAFTF